MSFSLAALAVSLVAGEVSGTWFGQGRVEDLKGKWGSNCEVAFRIETAHDELFLREGQYACEDFGMEWQPLRFRSESGRLFFQDTPVGTLFHRGFGFHLKGTDGTYWIADFKTEGDQAVWEDEMGEPGDGIRSRFELRRTSGPIRDMFSPGR